MNLVLRPSWLWALGPAVCLALIGATPGYVHAGGLFDPLYFGIGIMLGCIVAVDVRRLRITVVDDGLSLKQGYTGGLFCPWSEIVAVERRRRGPFVLDQLQLREPLRAFVRRNATGPPEVTWRPTNGRTLFIGVYDKDWRSGPIGAALTARGVSLEAIKPTRKPAVT